MNPRPTLKVSTRGHSDPPLLLGPQRLHYQYAVTVPQIHLTLVSVLQGIAFGVLLISIPLPDLATASSLIDSLLQQYLYLPYIISSMLIVFVWMQFASANLFLIWPFSTIQAGLVFILTVAEVIAFRFASSIPGWLVGTGAIAIIGGVIFLNNLRLRTQDDMQDRQAAAAEVRSNTLSGLTYICLGGIVMAFGIAQSHLFQNATGIVALSGNLLRWSELLILFAAMCALLALDAANRQHMLKQIAKDSDLVVLPHGKIRYRRPDE